MTQDPPIPVSIITGFLGSGKTTMLARLLQHPAMDRTAVIINEFGAIGLDHELIETSDETDVTLMGGCLCCTVKSDLIDTLKQLHARRQQGEVPRFGRLVIETTGLADPAPILQTIMADRLLQRDFYLGGVITLVDGVNGEGTLDRHHEALKQAAVADRLVITKTDMALSDEMAALKTRLLKLNPAAKILEASHGNVSPDMLFDAGIFSLAGRSPDVEQWLSEDAYDHDQDHHDHHHDINRHDKRISAFCIRHDQPIPSASASFFLDILMAERGEDLLRFKGIINIAEEPDKPMVLHGVQHVVHAPVYLERWPSEDRGSRLVFIVRDISKPSLERLLKTLLDNRPYHEIAKAMPLKAKS